jgi:hypothetical protein
MLFPEEKQNQRAQESNQHEAASSFFFYDGTPSLNVLLSTSFACHQQDKKLPRSEKTKAHTGNNKVKV